MMNDNVEYEIAVAETDSSLTDDDLDSDRPNSAREVKRISVLSGAQSATLRNYTDSGQQEAVKQIRLRKRAGAFAVFSDENPAQLPLKNTRLVVWVFHPFSVTDLLKSL